MNLLYRLSQETCDQGLTARHMAALAWMGMQSRHVTMGEIATAIGLTTAGITGMVDLLASRHLVTRQAAEGDRRKIIVALTEHGLSLLTQLNALLKSLIQEEAAHVPG